MPNPFVSQGTLNKVRANVVIASYTSLNVEASYLGDDGVSMEMDEDFVKQLKTQTGVVNSPEPYVEATVTMNLLRSQNLSLAWMQQAESNSQIGRVVVHSDSAAFTKRTIHNCSIVKVTPGRMNGTNATVDVVLRGVYYVNNDMWNAV